MPKGHLPKQFKKYGLVCLREVQNISLASTPTNIVTNGDGTTLTGWTVLSGGAGVSGGYFVLTGSGRIEQVLSVVSGHTYDISFDVGTAGDNAVVISSASNNSGTIFLNKPNAPAGTYNFTFTPTVSTVYLDLGTSAGTTARIGSVVITKQANASDSYDLTFDGDTANIGSTDTLPTIETSLNALSSITNNGGVTLSGTTSNYNINFASYGNKSDITVSNNTTGIAITQSTVSDGTCNPTQQQQSFVLSSSGATSGSYDINYNGESYTINYNDNLTVVESKFNVMTNVTNDGGVTLSGTVDNYTVTWNTLGPKGDFTITNNTLNIYSSVRQPSSGYTYKSASPDRREWEHTTNTNQYQIFWSSGNNDTVVASGSGLLSSVTAGGWTYHRGTQRASDFNAILGWTTNSYELYREQSSNTPVTVTVTTVTEGKNR